MKLHRKIRRNQGFTLIELIIAVLLSAILLAGMGAVISTAFNSYEYNTDVAERTQLIRSSLNRLTREIRNANQVEWDGASNQIVITKITTLTDGSTVTTTITYTLDTANEQLLYSNGTISNAVILGPEYGISVDAVSVDFIEPAESPTKTLLAKVTLTLDIDGDAVSVTASGSPRINHLYIPKTF